MLIRIADFMAAAAITVGAPLFRRVGDNPARFPAYRKQADRAGVHLRSTHYYQPVYADSDLPADVGGERDLPGLELNPAGQLELLRSFDFQQELERFGEVPADELGFGHDNGSYSHADAEALYCMIRMRKPKRLIEIGSGHSTRIASAAIAMNAEESGGRRCEHICVEPYEMEWLERLNVEVIRSRIQDVDPKLFERLDSGDILFVDSSHVIRPFGDVLCEYQRIVPRLNKGVLVHVHDIFTPRDYPEEWLREQRRLWNEQYLLEVLLAHSPRYRVVLALNYLKHAHFEDLASAFPSAARRPEHEPGAFWFEVVQ